jgi:hypothetical protein
MGLGKFPHPQLDMGIPAVSYCYHGDGSGESIPNGDLPIAICGRPLRRIQRKQHKIDSSWDGVKSTQYYANIKALFLSGFHNYALYISSNRKAQLQHQLCRGGWDATPNHVSETRCLRRKKQLFMSETGAWEPRPEQKVQPEKSKPTSTFDAVTQNREHSD